MCFRQVVVGNNNKRDSLRKKGGEIIKRT